ncbi:MAG: glycyl-radical enzyme activating protein [Clostridia bacterium]|nr:glycyl-radical enzyme activating protein [Clostridia bacterium]
MKGLIFSIEEFALYDGPGIRVNVFFKGCPLRCRWCHNPEGLSPEKQIVRSPNGCIGCGACRDVCESPESCVLCRKCIITCPRGLIRVCGEEWDSEALAKHILKFSPILSNGGVTFSGGEVLMQADFLSELLDRTASLHRAIETSGFGSTEAFERVLSKTDLVYFDLKVMDGEKHKLYTGVDNAVILKHAKMLMHSGVPYVFRVPFIKDVNTDEENLQRLKAFLSEAPTPPTVEFLLYNKMAGAKYPLAGMAYTEHFEQPDEADIERAKRILRAFNISFRK